MRLDRGVSLLVLIGIPSVLWRCLEIRMVEGNSSGHAHDYPIRFIQLEIANMDNCVLGVKDYVVILGIHFRDRAFNFGLWGDQVKGFTPYPRPYAKQRHNPS
jgi:hypothetical protein